MQSRSWHKVCKIFSLLLIMMVLFSAMLPMSARAAEKNVIQAETVEQYASSSWVDRNSSGIYNGSIDQWIESDNDTSEDEEPDAGNAWYINLINYILTWIPIHLADLMYGILDLLDASLDHLIYGRLASDTAFFTFGLEDGNIYGIVGSVIYSILRGITILGCMVVFMGNIAASTWKRGQFAVSGLKDAFMYFIVGVLLLVMMPYFLDVGLFVRDNILYLLAHNAGTTLFGGSSTSIISVLRESAKESFLNSVMYLAAVALNLSFLMSYVMVALSMLVNFILFPFVVLKSFFDRQILTNWTWEMVSCALVPVIDATLLMIPIFIGVYPAKIGLEGSGLAIAILQVLVCWAIVPARESARAVLGIRTNPLERSGIGASAFMGAMAFRGVKGMIGEITGDRESARDDITNSQMESELAAVDAQEAGQMEQEASNAFTAASAYAAAAESNEQKQMGEDEYGKNGMPSYGDEPVGEDEYNNQAKRPEDFATYDDGSAFGMEQNYADNMAAYQNSLEEESAIENKEAVDKALEDTNEQLAKVRKRKEDLLNDYADPNSINSPEKNEELANLEHEETALLARKRRLEERSNQELLKEEPSNLRSEMADADSKRQELLDQRQELVRERNGIQANRDLMSGDNEKYQELGKEIDAKNEAIRNIDTQIKDCENRKSNAAAALKSQKDELLDRQAYNLGERVKAQQEYDDAEAMIERYQNPNGIVDKAKNTAGETWAKVQGSSAVEKQQARMDAARQRMADLSVEDARINEKLQEYDPGRNQYTISDLQKAKGAQQVRKAEAQSKIAMLNAEIGSLDPANNDQKAEIEQKRRQIVRLTAESAEANLQAARFDQMISGLKESGGYGAATTSGRAGNGRSGVASEYDQKRRAIMERYATIDNFEEPQFKDISRERRAELLRERALHSKMRANGRILGNIAGGAVGMSMGLFYGPGGMAIGGIVGGKALAGVNVGIQNVRANRHMQRAGITPTNYANRPLSVHISSDLHSNSVDGQQQIVERVAQNFENSLAKDGRFEREFTAELIKKDVIQDSRRALLKRNGVRSAEEYQLKLPELRKQFKPMVVSGVRDKEVQILEKCAGAEYVNLSEVSKARILKKIHASPEYFVNQVSDNLRKTYLPDTWDPKFLE